MEQQRSEEQVIRERLAASPRSRGASQVETRLGLESAGSPRETLAAERPLADDGGHDDDDDGAVSDEDFAFAVTDGGSFEGLEAVTADEIFSNGLIRPVYPLFDRTTLVIDGGESSLRARGGGGEAGEAASAEKEKPAGQLPLRLRELILEDRDPPTSFSSSESEELEGVATGSYCVWAPRSAPASPDLRRKSHSAGASEDSKRWRLFGLVVGRSHSDGKERLVFLQEGAGAGAGQPKKKAAGDSREADKRGKGKGRSPGRTTEMDMETAHRLFYARGGAAAGGNRRRSFLPYRKDLLGFFGNVNGPSTFQPF